ncbi:helix-turn-helix transcriptional regulator [Acidaminococcus massiliensis]|jgi:DNA-binding XRE family transcriptional regulator|uniref:helix-turn-helix transcriptional regulator n=1 Tax=Acidaminococcus massiliensis TaxID=1852375 RepID=UPI00094E4CC4|nr:helix-turn-helix domain-containing protein [Acidaminococcus massiliensis]
MENLLVQLRGERTQTEMAEKYGVSQQSWSCWENGARKPPLNIMLRLEKDSGIPMEKIFYKEFNNYK